MLQYFQTPDGFIVDATNDYLQIPVFISAKTVEELKAGSVYDFLGLIHSKQWKRISRKCTLKNLEENKRLNNIYIMLNEEVKIFDNDLKQSISDEDWLMQTVHHKMGRAKLNL